jgi:TIR domain
MKIFLSYTHEDKQSATTLANGLKQLGHEVWIDYEGLQVGQEWWDQILTRIKGADVVVIAVSKLALHSDACKAEWEYARKLRRPTMPVLIEHIKIDLLPVEIARLQVVQVADFGRLVDAINHIQAIPLPDPLPEPPPIPMVWNAVHSVVYGSSVDFTAQVSVATKLIEHAQSFDLRKRKHARKLIADFLRRHDLFELTRTMLRSGIESSRLREWLVVGAVSGGLAITHVLWATGLYDLANSWLGEPRGTISLNFALAVLGGMLCYAAVRGKVRTARLGLAFCSLGMLGTVLDAIKIGWF